MRNLYLLHGRVTAATVVALAVVMPLSACGSDGGDAGGTGDVASISAPSAGASPAPAAGQGRPQQRLDSTDEEINQLRQVWYRCMKDHGGKFTVITKEDAARYPDKGIKDYEIGSLVPEGEQYKDGPGWTEPRRACASKEPLAPPELDPATNPEYADDWKAFIDCLRAGGLKVTPIKTAEGKDDVNMAGNGKVPDAEITKIYKACELKAFSSR
jgi:hypothetical protein